MLSHAQTILDECSQLVEPLSLSPIIRAQSRWGRGFSGAHLDAALPPRVIEAELHQL